MHVLCDWARLDRVVSLQTVTMKSVRCQETLRAICYRVKLHVQNYAGVEAETALLEASLRVGFA